ncbi:hypothetical protein TSUD_114910 [Trifolium subterraneum]|uniref:Ribonuclease H1 N-terminal domain-containing protein n=1 Tax=Trifolium subterraneum TaxID=3900 RepID=A0A2Z6NJP2_TRISU|nr:hypothetical protein TSUD_114910 [Trifolium subterraneum]
MTNVQEDVFHVVFEGKNPGVYPTWEDAAEQVVGWSGNRHVKYPTFVHAMATWVKFCNKKGMDPNKGIHINKDSQIGSSSQTNTDVNDNVQPNMLAIDTTSGEFIIQHSMQTEVERICYAYGIPPPTYTLQEKRLLDGVPYVRYYGALVAGAIGSPCVSLGRFARLDDDAREDVAAILIGRLLSVAGHTIRYFNYYNVQQLQQQVEMMKKEILELKYELGIQNEDKVNSK